jgi:hypothetical protein
MGAEKRQKPTSYLVIQAGTGDKQVIVWDTLDITVGRNDSQDIVVADPEVSREHALFRRRGEDCVLQDLSTGLGTNVDGKPIKEHALQHGNSIEIGTLQIEFGQSEKPLTRGKNVRFASELKEFGLSALEDGAGRTMLGFDSEDDLLSKASASKSATPRAVTADGTVEIDELGSDTLDLGAQEIEVRNLDLDLAEEIPPLSGSATADKRAATAPTESALDPRTSPDGKATSAAAPLDPIEMSSDQTPSEANAAEVTTKLVLEVNGPADKVQAFLEAVRDKRIQLPPIELLVRDI